MYNINNINSCNMKNRHIVIEGNLGDEIYVEDNKQEIVTAFFKDFPEMTSEGKTIEEAQSNLWKMLYDILQYYFKQK
jgi:predicted RNase H-like HicB family nuclease